VAMTGSCSDNVGRTGLPPIGRRSQPRDPSGMLDSVLAR
jgi:hypothetical protein